MTKVYYTEEHTNYGVLHSVLKKALKLIEEQAELSTIVLLFPTLSVADDVLSDVLPELTRGSRCFHNDKPSCVIRVETVKTFSPSNPHILAPICVTEKEFIKFEDEWESRIWIVAPYNLPSLDSWLKVHSAVNVETGEALIMNESLDIRVINGIEWLWATSYPNEGFNHPLDLNRLKCMANALAANNVPLEYYPILHYCITHNINHDGGRKIADHFVKAQVKKFKTDGNYPISFMNEMMNTKHKRI